LGPTPAGTQTGSVGRAAREQEGGLINDNGKKTAATS
jgi:hypothetical protein